ncbi:MAG TPA: hypothetical protein PLE74_06625 [Candidatus Cloacimonadota bacterium]|nr:hypothetical protein [Candidatus Cloacimonadota bacterium]
MKLTFKHCVKTFKGINRKECLVYYSYNGGDLIIAKRLTNRKLTSQNHEMGNIIANLSLHDS